MKKPLFACLAIVVLSTSDSVAFAADSDHHKKLSLQGAEATINAHSAVSPRSEGKHFSGNAHWYGGSFHGKRTASGEVFDKHKMTCAHPSLPFGTHVKVHSLHTGKDVVVRVTDRCPRMSVRCIDLSEGAARKIGIFPNAPGKVKCEVLSSTAGKEAWAKQVAQQDMDTTKSKDKPASDSSEDTHSPSPETKTE